MSAFEFLTGLAVLALVAGGILFFIIRDARNMNKRAGGPNGHRRRAKPTRGLSSNQSNGPIKGAGIS